jgi:hypothetical protein
MNPSVNQRVAPKWVVLILALLLGVWLVFQFYPRKKPVPPLPPLAAETKLNAVGLANNPDWDGLPEFFAIVENRAEWKDGRTRFAYWHPVMKTYSYYFEATRDGTGFRFKEIAEPHDPDCYLEENPAEDSRIRFYNTVQAIKPRPAIIPTEGYPDVPAKIDIDTKIPRIPPPERKIISEDQGKKP